jgi:hypothetical protein
MYPLSDGLSRRGFLHLTAGLSVVGWFGRLAADTAKGARPQRSCILLWMAGGPAQTDTFDLKPDHKNGGPFKPIVTNVTGLRIGEHLPQLARRADRLAVLRSVTSSEGDHSRATYHLRTGYRQQGPVLYPPLGALVSSRLSDDSSALPGFVSISPARGVSPLTYGPGFLGPRHAPLMVGAEAGPSGEGGGARSVLRVEDLARPRAIGPAQAEARRELWQELERDFVAGHPGAGPKSHQAAYERAVRLMHPDAARAFDLEAEPARTREAYGKGLFGQGCLLARRLIERGVPFVEVTLGGWDTHINNFELVRRRCEVLDPAWSALLDDLKDRGLIDSTLVVWMGEFGRTPQINSQVGRDHYPAAWSVVLGGAVRGGQVIGRTSKDGTRVEERPISVPDLMATVCHGMGIDATKQNLSNVGRPIRIADVGAKPVREALP